MTYLLPGGSCVTNLASVFSSVAIPFWPLRFCVRFEKVGCLEPSFSFFLQFSRKCWNFSAILFWTSFLMVNAVKLHFIFLPVGFADCNIWLLSSCFCVLNFFLRRAMATRVTEIFSKIIYNRRQFGFISPWDEKFRGKSQQNYLGNRTTNNFVVVAHFLCQNLIN